MFEQKPEKISIPLAILFFLLLSLALGSFFASNNIQWLWKNKYFAVSPLDKNVTGYQITQRIWMSVDNIEVLENENDISSLNLTLTSANESDSDLTLEHTIALDQGMQEFNKTLYFLNRYTNKWETYTDKPEYLDRGIKKGDLVVGINTAYYENDSLKNDLLIKLVVPDSDNFSPDLLIPAQL